MINNKIKTANLNWSICTVRKYGFYLKNKYKTCTDTFFDSYQLPLPANLC